MRKRLQSRLAAVKSWSSRKRRFVFLGVLVGLPLLAVLLYQIPPIHDRLQYRVSALRSQIKYALNPPEAAIFLPQEQEQAQALAAMVQATLHALTPTASPPGPSPTPAPTATATISPTPLPPRVELTGVTHHPQHWNNCGPATLTMGLSFWGLRIFQGTTAAYLKPNQRDVNVMPQEMLGFIEEKTKLHAILRIGGEPQLLKSLLASGYPVIVEKGFTGRRFDDWMGHYELLTGFDESEGYFIAQDSYQGPDFLVPYDSLTRDWRAFNYTFLVMFPPEHESRVMDILGPWSDPAWAAEHAMNIASQESDSLSGRPLFFAWFNIGDYHLSQQDYTAAAQAYDHAFFLYSLLPEDDRPWRMMWYRTGPYTAYFETGRYQDLIALANTTLLVMSEPVLEETYYWRGRAYEASGQLNLAVNDYLMAADLNPNFAPAFAELSRLGVEIEAETETEN